MCDSGPRSNPVWGEEAFGYIWAGGTENSAVCGALIDDLIARGLQRPELVVLDGSKASERLLWTDGKRQ